VGHEATIPPVAFILMSEDWVIRTRDPGDDHAKGPFHSTSQSVGQATNACEIGLSLSGATDRNMRATGNSTWERTRDSLGRLPSDQNWTSSPFDRRAVELTSGRVNRYFPRKTAELDSHFTTSCGWDVRENRRICRIDS